MWDTGAFLMDFGTYCYVIAIEVTSGSIISMMSRTEVLIDRIMFSAVSPALPSSLFRLNSASNCLEKKSLKIQSLHLMLIWLFVNAVICFLCDCLLIYMQWNNSCEIVFFELQSCVKIEKHQVRSDHIALPPVIHSSKWWMWREECDNKESTPWNFSSLLSCSLAVLYTFF